MTKPFQDVIDKQCPDCGATGCGINFEQTQKLSAIGVAKRFKKDVSKLTDLEKWSGYRESMKRRQLDPDCVTCRGVLHWADMEPDRFKRYRQGLGLSINNIAELADVEPRTVRRWEDTKKPPEDVVDIIFSMEWLVISYIYNRYQASSKNEPKNKPLLYDFMRKWDKILPDFQTDTYYRIWVSTLERRWNEYLRVILCAKWFSQ